MHPILYSHNLIQCKLCPAYFITSQELDQHFDLHFNAGRCGTCEQQLICIDDQFYVLELHDNTKCNQQKLTSRKLNGELSLQRKDECSDEGAVKEEFDEFLTENRKKAVRRRPARKRNINDNENISESSPIRERRSNNNTLQKTVNDAEEVEHFEMVECMEIKMENEWLTNRLDDNCVPSASPKIINQQNPNEPSVIPLTADDFKKLPSYRISAKSSGEKHLRQYQCDICARYLLSKRTLAAHMKLHRTEAASNVCDICNKVLKTKSGLRVHKEVHSDAKRFICSYCGKGFRIKNNLTEHTNSHTGSKPYACTECNKSFGRRTHLIVHMRIHTGHKPYKCSVAGCERTYAHGIDLKRHLYGAHRIYTKKHECQICSRIYSERKLLTKHMKSHCS